METFKCDTCDTTFRDIGKLSGRKRLFHHIRTDHKAAAIVGRCLSHIHMGRYTNIRVMTLFASGARQPVKGDVWKK